MLSAAEVAKKYVDIGKGKAELPAGRAFCLAVLAGAFIALAGVGSTVGGALTNKVVGAAIFPAGLAMVVVAGSELFTGNCLLVIPLLERKITLQRMLCSWLIVYLGNLVGGVLVAAVTSLAGTFDAVSDTVAATAAAKTALPFGAALLRGILCNFLVCIAVWMALAAQTVGGKIAGVFFPVFLFVLCGFEHSVANMFYIPAGFFVRARCGAEADITLYGMWVRNLLPVTLGNIIGGGAVGAAYRTVYLRKK